MGKKFNVPKLIPVGSTLVCADGTGAKKLQVIGYKGYQGTRKRRLTGGVGSVAIVTVKEGLYDLKKKVHYALIIRQKYPITRKLKTTIGSYVGKVKFEDNAALLLDKNLAPLKASIKGVIAKEVAEKQIYSALNGVYR